MLTRLHSVLIVGAFALVPLWLRLPLPVPLTALRSVVLLTMLAAVIVWLLRGLPGLRTLTRGQHLFAALIGRLLVWTLASPLWSFMRPTRPEVAINAAVQAAIVLTFALCVLAVRPPLKPIALGWAIGGGLLALLTIAQAAAQESIGLLVLGEFPITAADGPSVIRAGMIEYVRPYGLMPHPNANAGALLIGLLAAVGLASVGLAAGGMRRAIAISAGLGAIAFALLLTFSRAAWIGAAIGGALLLPGLWPLLRTLPRRRVALTIGAVGIAGAVFVAQYTPLITARTGTTQESIELRSVADRLIFTEYALRALRDHPLTGVGAGNFPWQASAYLTETFYELRGDNVHNVLLSTAAELGLVGAALLIAAHAVGVGLALRQLHRSTGTDRAVRAGLFGVWAGLAIVGLFDHYPYTFPGFQLAWWGALALLTVPPQQKTLLTVPPTVPARAD